MKRTMIKPLAALVLAAGFAFGIQSCKKEKEEEKKLNANDAQAALELSIAEQYFGDLKSIADQSESGSLTSYKSGSGAGCATITHNTMTKTIVVDFGSTNCLCQDYNLRRGVITITYTGNYWDSGNVITVVPDHYFVNDYQLIGTKTIHNLGKDTGDNPHWKIQVSGIIRKPNQTDSINYTTDRVHTWVKGSSTPLNWYDDEWLIDGTADMHSSNGTVWNLSISKSLHKALLCRHVDEGVLDISIQGGANAAIDYGNGVCDNDAIFIYNGVNYPIKLH